MLHLVFTGFCQPQCKDTGVLADFRNPDKYGQTQNCRDETVELGNKDNKVNVGYECPRKGERFIHAVMKA